MTRFIVRRLLLSIPVLLGVVLLVFILARIIPGDPCVATYGEKANAAVCAAFNHRYGLDKPIIEQFVIYLGALLTGDLGTSVKYGRPVADVLLERLPMTVELTIMALTFATVFGLILGLSAAMRRNSAADVGTMVVANLGVSIPVFVLGLILAFTFAVLLKDTPLVLPPSGRLSPGVSVVPLATTWGLESWTGPPRVILDFISRMYILHGLLTANWALFTDAFRHLILPAVAVGTIPLAIIARMTRSSLLEVLGLDYVRTARAKGVKERTVILRHGLRNAMLPVVTVIGLSLGALLSGAVLTETIFGLTGVGQTLFESINSRDYSIIQGATILVAVIYVVVNLVVDVVLRVPRSPDQARLMSTVPQPVEAAVGPSKEKVSSLRRDTARNVVAPALGGRRPGHPRDDGGGRALRPDHRAARSPRVDARHRGDRRAPRPGAVHPPAWLPRRPAPAHHGPRLQPARRVQPSHLRRPGLAPGRDPDGRVGDRRRDDAGGHRRVRRRADGQPHHARPGRRPGVPEPHPRDRHRDRARLGAVPGPDGRRDRVHPHLRARHARVPCSRRANRSSSRRPGHSANRRAGSCRAGSSRTR